MATNERCWNCGAKTEVIGKDGDGDPMYRCPKCGCDLIGYKLYIQNQGI